MTPKHLYITKEDAEYLADNMTAGMTAHTQRPMLHTGTTLVKYTDLAQVFYSPRDIKRRTDINLDELYFGFFRDGGSCIGSADYLLSHADEVVTLAKIEDLKNILKP